MGSRTNRSSSTTEIDSIFRSTSPNVRGSPEDYPINDNKFANQGLELPRCRRLDHHVHGASATPRWSLPPSITSRRPLAQLDPGKRDAVVQEFRASGGVPTTTLARVIQQCYCRGDRALRSLGRESRAPLPKGHVLPDTATGRCSARSRRGEPGYDSHASAFRFIWFAN
jgi:hypothetical protein